MTEEMSASRTVPGEVAETFARVLPIVRDGGRVAAWRGDLELVDGLADRSLVEELRAELQAFERERATRTQRTQEAGSRG